MVQETQVEKLEHSSVKLTVSIAQSDVSAAYEKVVGKYQKEAHIKGFRKGKAPRDVLERKFAESFRFEALSDLFDTGLREAFDHVDKKPLPYSQPELVEEVELDTAKDLVFAVTYDVYPDVNIESFEGIDITRPLCKITKKDEDREIENLQQQNALVVDKDNDTVEEGDVVTVDFEEVDESDTAIEGTGREDFTYTAGTEENRYRFDADLMGAKSGETRTFEKKYAKNDKDEELAGTTRRLRVTVKGIKLRDVPEIDDEFAQDISDEFETLADLRKDIRERLTNNADAKIRSLQIDQVLSHLSETYPFDLPESMVRSELDSSWRSMTSQYRATEEQMTQILAMQGTTLEDLFEEWRPEAEKRLRRTLIVQKLIETEKIEVSNEEAENHVRAEAEANKSDVDQVIEYYRNNQMLPYIQQELAERRLFDTIIEKAKVSNGDKMSYVDLMNEKR